MVVMYGFSWFRDGKGKGEALLGDVAGLATDPFDTIYFCDYAHGAVRAISPDGEEERRVMSGGLTHPFLLHWQWCWLSARLWVWPVA